MYQIVEYALWVAFAFIIMLIAVLLYRKSSGDREKEPVEEAEADRDASSGNQAVSGGITDEDRSYSDDPRFAGAGVHEGSGEHTGKYQRAADAGENGQWEQRSDERQSDSGDSVFGKNTEAFTVHSRETSSASDLQGCRTDSTGGAEMAEADIPPENYRLFDSPVSGRVIPLAQAPEEVFASGAAGIGVGIVPDNGNIYAPFDGTVRFVYPGGHALSLASVDGVEAVIHMGIDTVRLEGRGFQVNVRQGMAVQRGDLIAVFDPAYLRAHEYDTTVLYLLTNQPEEIQMKAATGDCVEALQPVIGVARLQES